MLYNVTHTSGQSLGKAVTIEEVRRMQSCLELGQVIRVEPIHNKTRTTLEIIEDDFEFLNNLI